MAEERVSHIAMNVDEVTIQTDSVRTGGAPVSAAAVPAVKPVAVKKKRAAVKEKVVAEKKPAKVSLEDAAREALRVLSALPAVSEKELWAAARGLTEALDG